MPDGGPKERSVPRGWVKKSALWTGRVFLAGVIGFALVFGFGTPGADALRMRAFDEACTRWQRDPEFRQVQVEYVELGSAAMQTRAGFVDTTKGIMWLRSLPGLPPHLAVNPTSQNHYDNFTRGPLSAYLHLTTETDHMIGDSAKMLRYVARNPVPADAEIRDDFLKNFKFEGYTVCTDAGAVDSVRKLINDVDVTRDLAVTSGLRDRYLPHIRRIANTLGYPTEVDQMTSAQQAEVRRMLDTEILEKDYELWRAKQVNDWCNGLWAQIYGTMYAKMIRPALVAREVGRIGGPLALALWVGLILHRRRKTAEEPVPAALGPQLALDGGKGGDDSV